jgi:hypothetical protein
MDRGFYFLRVLYKMDAMSQTDVIGTCRNKAIIYPVVTEVALLCNSFVLIKGNGPVGTGFKTKGTPRAPVFMQHHDTVLSLRYGLFGTHGHAGRIVTVFADIDLKSKIHLIRGLLIDFLRHGDQLGSKRGIDLLFTGNLAGLTPPASVVIDV